MSDDFRIDIFLSLGDFYFGDESTIIRTTLGSCVSVTVWQPRLRVGGMCHFVLPSRTSGMPLDPEKPRGWYGVDAFDMFLEEMRTYAAPPSSYEAKIFGGGRQFSGAAGASDIAERNVRVGMGLVAQYGMHLEATHVGGEGSRQLIFDVATGSVWLRHAGRLDDIGVPTRDPLVATSAGPS